MNIEREKLYNKIEDRVENMFKKGLIEEVKRLKDRYPLNCPPFKSLGYKEILMVMDGEIDLETAKGLIKQRSRNFAKRQMSWFRQEKDIQWFDPAAFDNMVTYVKEELKK